MGECGTLMPTGRGKIWPLVVTQQIPHIDLLRCSNHGE